MIQYQYIKVFMRLQSFYREYLNIWFVNVSLNCSTSWLIISLTCFHPPEGGPFSRHHTLCPLCLSAPNLQSRVTDYRLLCTLYMLHLLPLKSIQFTYKPKMLSFVSLAPLCFDILLPYWKGEWLNILLSQKESKQTEDLIYTTAY